MEAVEHLETTAPAWAWSDRMLVGHAAIDGDHREFVELVGRLLAAPDGALPQVLDAVARHAEAHFAREEALMERHDCPARDCHADEHGRVLDSLHEVSALVAAGERAVARELAAALADWLPGHCEVMDSAVATWIAKRTVGGAPLVLRRHAAVAHDPQFNLNA